MSELQANAMWLVLVPAYAVAVTVIARWIPVVRERRLRWFTAHQVAVGVIVLGNVARDRAVGVIVNGLWFLVAAGWYVLGGRSSDKQGSEQQA